MINRGLGADRIVPPSGEDVSFLIPQQWGCHRRFLRFFYAAPAVLYLLLTQSRRTLQLRQARRLAKEELHCSKTSLS